MVGKSKFQIKEGQREKSKEKTHISKRKTEFQIKEGQDIPCRDMWKVTEIGKMGIWRIKSESMLKNENGKGGRGQTGKKNPYWPWILPWGR